MISRRKKGKNDSMPGKKKTGARRESPRARGTGYFLQSEKLQGRESSAKNRHCANARPKKGRATKGRAKCTAAGNEKRNSRKDSKFGEKQ